jgi:hypothetical protein
MYSVCLATSLSDKSALITTSWLKKSISWTGLAKPLISPLLMKGGWSMEQALKPTMRGKSKNYIRRTLAIFDSSTNHSIVMLSIGTLWTAISPSGIIKLVGFEA